MARKLPTVNATSIKLIPRIQSIFCDAARRKSRGISCSDLVCTDCLLDSNAIHGEEAIEAIRNLLVSLRETSRK